MRKILPLLFILQSCIGAGDMFASRKKIVGNYYLLEDEGGGYSISYDVGSGGYVGRNPSDSKVLAYAVRDSLMVMKVRFYDSTVNYYVINMNKDSDIADEKEIVMDTIGARDFHDSWLGKQSLKFEIVKE